MTDSQSDAEGASNPVMPFELGGPDYFRTFEIPILRGRGFLPTDTEGSPRVLVVSAAAATQFWPGENPIGRQLRLTSDSPRFTVVGEAGDIRYRSLRETPPTIYEPWRQVSPPGALAIRTQGAVESLLPLLREAVVASAPGARIARVETMDQIIGEQLALPRISSRLLSAFGLTALLLAAMGLYGAMASVVRDRRHEFGVRAALGAAPLRLSGEVLAHAGVIAVAGGLVGLGGVVVLSRFLTALLFDVPPTDSVALGGASGLMFVVCVVATYVPSWQAARSDPAAALRAE